VKKFSGTTTTVTFPTHVDAIVGNPPYTRQEEMEALGGKKGYKSNLIEKAIKSAGPVARELSDRSGIHTYFFLHGTTFLRAGGRFGFVVSDTWLDADYGTGLKKFLLNTYRIHCVMASKVERWFADADINTCIVLLEREPDQAKRESFASRFVLLKRPIKDLIPMGGSPASERMRFDASGRLMQLIDGHSSTYENDDCRIAPIIQRELIPDHKWGIRLRAPSIFLETASRNTQQFATLSSLANICRGITSGADPWFFVRQVLPENADEIKKRVRAIDYVGSIDKLQLIESGDGTRWLIEKEFLVPIVRNPEQYRAVRVSNDSISDLAVAIPLRDRKALKGTALIHYISHGERRAYGLGKGRRIVPAKTESCAARRFWYSLPDIQRARILWQKAFDVGFRHLIADRPVLANQRFYPILPASGISEEYVTGFLNSAFVPAWLEVQRAAMGMGAIEATVDEVKNLKIVDPRTLPSKVVQEVEAAIRGIMDRPIGSVFDEYGATEPQDVTWERMPADRRRLEEAVLGGVLGLDVGQQLDFIRALVDLTRSRIMKANSVQSGAAAEREAMKEFAKRIAGGIDP
jgi:hypothetical protein